IVCIPLGGALAAQLSARVIPVYGWRALFLVGGIIPTVLALILFKILPESPRYMASRRDRWPELIALLRRIGNNVPSDATFAETGTARTSKAGGSIRDLFAPALRRDTL